MPVGPFQIPDLICLVAAAWLFALLAERLAASPRWTRGMGALVFLGTLLASPKLLDAWIVPWSTTPATPLIFGCLLAALHFEERPTARTAFIAALVGVSIILFRPADVVVFLAIVPFMLRVLLCSPGSGRAKLKIVGAAIAGALPPLIVLLAVHCTVFGLMPGAYLGSNAGFEWRLLPLRWVTLFINSRPLFPEGPGLAQTFPWILPGIAGMVAIPLISSRRDRGRHLLVVAAVAIYCAVYLAYRDLHPQGLWRYNNYHYFKWTLPIFAFYGVFWIVDIVASNRRSRLIVPGALAVVALFSWRAEWRAPASAYSSGDAVVSGAHQLILRHGPWSVDAGVLFGTVGKPEWGSIYFADQVIRIGGETFHLNADFKIFPVAAGLLLAPLRRLPAGEAVISFDPGITVDPNIPPVIGRQRVVFGLPCWSRFVCAH
jgi:hypothetical protein